METMTLTAIGMIRDWNGHVSEVWLIHHLFFYQESNNNHTGSSNEDDKSSTKSSSSSRSSRCSDNSLASIGGGERGNRGEDPAKNGKSGNGMTPTEATIKRQEDSRHKIEDRHKEKSSKGRSDREKKDRHESRNSKEHGHRDYRLAIFSWVFSLHSFHVCYFPAHVSSFYKDCLCLR